MSPAPVIEKSQLVAQAEPSIRRFEPVAIVLGLVAFLAVLAVGYALYLVKFQVDHRIVQAACGGVAVLSIVVFFRITPASRLSPRERMVRHNRSVFALLGLMTGAALLGSIATADQLDTAEDWLMLAFIASSPIGLFFLINTRFSIG